MRLFGVAVVVTETGPPGVCIHAVTLMGFHTARGSQNHVLTPTTIRSEAGAVRNNNDGTNRETLLPADCATRVGVSVRIHWYPTILFPHAF